MVSKRSRIHETETAVIKSWQAEDFQVAQVRSKYGLPTYFLVIENLSNGNQVVRSRHRKRTAAIKKCEALERAEAY